MKAVWNHLKRIRIAVQNCLLVFLTGVIAYQAKLQETQRKLRYYQNDLWCHQTHLWGHQKQLRVSQMNFGCHQTDLWDSHKQLRGFQMNLWCHQRHLWITQMNLWVSQNDFRPCIIKLFAKSINQFTIFSIINLNIQYYDNKSGN